MYTHFVSLPLAKYAFKNELEDFQSSIMDVENNPLKLKATLAEMRIDKSIFAKPQSSHLTVVMLKLRTKESMNEAYNILKNMTSLLDKPPVSIRLKGLASMTEDLETTHVLYVPVEEVGDENRLLTACHATIDAFVEAGFAEEDSKTRFMLHATVMNANYRYGDKSQTIDAREIHEKFVDKDWGTYLIREAHISKRSEFDDDGYFKCCAKVVFSEE